MRWVMCVLCVLCVAGLGHATSNAVAEAVVGSQGPAEGTYEYGSCQ
jgi:hypothetical protein